MRRGIKIMLGLTGAAFLVFQGAGGMAAAGERELIDRVIAVVEDRAILQSEYQTEFKRLMVEMGEDRNLSERDRETLKREVLEGLVADLLMAVHAERIGVETEQQNIDAEVEKAIQRNKSALGGEKAFREELERNGLTEQQLIRQWREKIEARQLIEKLMYQEVMGEIEITDSELKDFYLEKLEELPPRPPTVKLAQILITPEASGQSKKEALDKIRAIEEKIVRGADFEEMAREYSEGPSAEYGGNLGTVSAEDLNNEEFARAAAGLKAGEVSQPVLTSFGYHLIKLEGREDGMMKLRHILVKVEEGSGELNEARRRADDLRERIRKGEDFGKLAAEYSSDQKSREMGGMVGEVPVSSLPEFFREAIKGVKPGEVAPVIKDSKGFRIIKVLERNEERPYTFKEAEEELRNILRREKLQKKYSEYVEMLKEKYYVDIKEDFEP